MVEELLLCECGDPNHQLIIFYDNDEDNTQNVYLSMHLKPESNFFKRLWRGFKYIFFNEKSIYGDFDEIILRPQDAEKLQNVVDILYSKLNQNQINLIIQQNVIPS